MKAITVNPSSSSDSCSLQLRLLQNPQLLSSASFLTTRLGQVPVSWAPLLESLKEAHRPFSMSHVPPHNHISDKDRLETQWCS